MKNCNLLYSRTIKMSKTFLRHDFFLIRTTGFATAKLLHFPMGNILNHNIVIPQRYNVIISGDANAPK